MSKMPTPTPTPMPMPTPTPTPMMSSGRYPYETDYNDHFETPLIAYRDIVPILEYFRSIKKGGRNRAKKGETKEKKGKKNGRSNKGREDKKKKEKRKIKVDGEKEEEGESDRSDGGDDDGDNSNEDDDEDDDDIAIYDPYYCEGRVATILKELGYNDVVHERRDFYLDVERGTVPRHDVFLTNPPYSDENKIKCLRYCFERLRGRRPGRHGRPSDSGGSYKDDDDNNNDSSNNNNNSSTPFLILMPCYVASKQYYRGYVQNEELQHDDDVLYVVPSIKYEYDHPEGTGKETSPFDSMWYCGVGRRHAASIRRYYEDYYCHHGRRHDDMGKGQKKNCDRPHPTAKLVSSLRELQDMNVISLRKRLNPKQRQRRKRQRQQQQLQQQQQQHHSLATPSTTRTTGTNDGEEIAPPNKKMKKKKSKKYPDHDDDGKEAPANARTTGENTRAFDKKKNNNNRKRKKTGSNSGGSSKYRDEKGKRTKKRF